MKGLTGERKRWPVLINRRRDTPKVSHSQAHNGVLHQAEPGMEYGRSEWRLKKKRLKPSFSLHPSLLLYFYFIAFSPGLYGPIVHAPFNETVFRESHVTVFLCSENPTGQFCKYGSWQWVWKDGTFPEPIQCRPLLLLFQILLHPLLNPITLSLAPPLSVSFRCINWSQEHWQPIWGRGVGAYLATSQVKKGRGLWGATGEVWTHLPLIILPVRGFSLDLWTSELPHTTNLLINREIPWKNVEQPLCVRVHVCTKVCKGKRQQEQHRESVWRVACGNSVCSWHILPLLCCWIRRARRPWFYTAGSRLCCSPLIEEATISAAWWYTFDPQCTKTNCILLHSLFFVINVL